MSRSYYLKTGKGNLASVTLSTSKKPSSKTLGALSALVDLATEELKKLPKIDIPMTQYQTAWAQYVASTDYATATYAMKSAGMQQPYIDNILRNAFDAAWRKK